MKKPTYRYTCPCGFRTNLSRKAVAHGHLTYRKLNGQDSPKELPLEGDSGVRETGIRVQDQLRNRNQVPRKVKKHNLSVATKRVKRLKVRLGQLLSKYQGYQDIAQQVLTVEPLN